MADGESRKAVSSALGSAWGCEGPRQWNRPRAVNAWIQQSLSLCLGVTVTLLVGLSFLRTPLPTPGLNTLDDSFYQAYGYFLKHRLQAGEDYVFPFGPLRYFYRSTYDPELYWHVYAWQLLAKLVMAAVVVHFFWSIPFVGRRLIALTAVVGPALLLEWLPDSTYILCLLLMFGGTIANDRPTFMGLLPLTLVMGVLFLMKLNLFLLCPFFIAFLSLHLWKVGQRWLAAAFPALCGLVLGILWTLLGQSLANIPAYVRGSVELTIGYTQAMATDGIPLVIVIALLTALTLFGALLPLSLSELGRIRQLVSYRFLAVAFLVVASTFTVWKHALVRFDGPSHTCFLFAFTLPLAFAVPRLLPQLAWQEPYRITLLASCGTFSTVGLLACLPFAPEPSVIATTCRQNLAERIGFALWPTELRAELDQKRHETQEQAALPNVRQRVGHEDIDFVSFEQGVVLLNDLKYRPRPVIQSYSAFTPYLSTLNAHFYRQAASPRFVLFKLQPIDIRFPTLEDGLTFLELWRAYRPVLSEKGYVLLERRLEVASTGEAAAKVVLEKSIGFDEEVNLRDLPEGCYVLHLTAPLSRSGTIKSVVYKLPDVMIKVKTATRGELEFRFIPPMAQTGFLLNPLLVDENDVLNLYAGVQGERVEAFTIVTTCPEHYQDQMQIKVLAVSRPPPAKIETP